MLTEKRKTAEAIARDAADAPQLIRRLARLLVDVLAELETYQLLNEDARRSGAE